ncbi:MAG TPA: ATP-binding protein [Tissierellaceae bacterium]|nr:ATP-binding protein [Tissierellaceae bacterium]
MRVKNDLDNDLINSMDHNEKQLRFILGLTDKLRFLSDPNEVQKTIIMETMNYFNSDICYYWETCNDKIIVKQDVLADELYSAIRKFKLDEHRYLKRVVKYGKPIIVNNLDHLNSLDHTVKQFFVEIRIRSFLIVPIVKKTNTIGILTIGKCEPYKWTKSDIRLGIDIAERTWMAVERAKDEKERELLLSRATEERKKLEAIIENIDANVWFSDTSGNITSLNFNHIEGLARKIHRKSIYDLIDELPIFQMDGSLMSKDVFPLFQAIEGEKVRWEERTLLPETGEERYREHRSSPIKDEYGEVIGVVGLTQDITGRKNLEQSLIESRKKGLNLIRELKRAEKLRTLFLSSLSHELRNPLATIMMGLNLLHQTEQSKEIQEKTIEMMHRQGEQLSQLVDDLLDMTRITQNKFELKLETIELNRLLNNIIEDNSPHFEKKRIKNKRDIIKEKLYIKGDPIRLTQAIENLLNNAEKFTPKDGEIRIKLDKDCIRNEAVLSIKDNGEGISRKILKEIFEPFVQVKNDLGKNSDGLGIGLSIVKDIIDRHNGNIEVFSDGRGWGTEFIIKLPILQNER